MSGEFWIEEGTSKSPVATLKVGGRMGANPAKELRARCADLKEQGFDHMVIDMSAVTFIASSGVGALIVLTGEFSIRGGSTHFVALSQPVQRAIELLNLSKFLTVHASEEEALAVLQGQTL